MFSQEYIDFAINSRAIQDLWRKRGPRVGDWFWLRKNKYLLLYYEDAKGALYFRLGAWATTWGLIDDARWLPTTDDLMEAFANTDVADTMRLWDKLEAARLLERVLEGGKE